MPETNKNFMRKCLEQGGFDAWLIAPLSKLFRLGRAGSPNTGGGAMPLDRRGRRVRHVPLRHGLLEGHRDGAGGVFSRCGPSKAM